LHTKSLGVLRTERLPDGRVVEVVERTWEQRYTNFGQAVLTGVVLIRRASPEFFFCVVM
jgi:hypothetical protein